MSRIHLRVKYYLTLVINMYLIIHIGICSSIYIFISATNSNRSTIAEVMQSSCLVLFVLILRFSKVQM